MASFDLKDGFYALGIAPEHRKYFTLNVNGELLQNAALPMGWNVYPYVFTKLTQVLTTCLRAPRLAREARCPVSGARCRPEGASRRHPRN